VTRRLVAGLALAWLSAGPSWAASGPACVADPLAGRALYLRGTFNSWGSAESQKFTWACNRWELVTRLSGEHKFKFGDEAWSADADFGQRPGQTDLVPRGPELQRRFDGTYRFTLAMTDPKTPPQLRIESCPAPAPLGDTVLFLRGPLNNWASLDDFAFQYSCDAYYLNLKASGRQEFKIADASWTPATTWPASGNSAPFVHDFNGEHTLRLSFDAGRHRLDIGPKTFADPAARQVNDPVALSVRFDSRAAEHKQPFGAVTAGSTLTFALTAAPGVTRVTLVVEKRRFEGNQEVLEYSEVARVPMAKARAGDRERWTASHRFADVSVYGYWFEVQIGERLFAFQNNTDAVFWTREKGSGGAGAVADLPQALRNVRRFRQTVYAADFKVPDWAPDIVYYYIFPERFRNGDKGNDPRPGRDRFQDHTVEVHKDWNERTWRPGTGDGSDKYHSNDFYGGDLAGITEKLDYIRDLGANTIYMTPVFRAPSNHKYDTADYKQIDPAFGSNEDFVLLTREAARRGIRVIPDTSLNHTGSDSIYFDRYGNFRQGGAFEGGKVRPASPYAGWFRFDTTQADPDRQYKGWGGPDLPELDKASPDFRRYAYGAPDSVMKLWLDRGAAGWRMDVAPWVPDDFWREWRIAIKQHQPEALTVAETWFDASKYFLGDMFDSTMNYIFRNTVLEYAAGGKMRALYANIELMREAYPPQAFYALMNLLSSHDQARALHHFGWHDDTRDGSTIALAKQRLKLAVLFQMIFPGAPTVYYGDEVGVTGGDDPYNRSTYPWADLGGRPDTALLAEFKRLIRMRHDHAVLRRGSIDAPLYIDDQVVVLLRRMGSTWAVTATNNAQQPRTVRLPLPAGAPLGVWKDALDGGDVAPAADGVMVLTIPALFGRVLVSP